MVEEVVYNKEPKPTKKNKKSLIIGFYIWNLNLYITSLLSFNNIYLIGFFIYLINIFCFRTLFGRFQNLKTILFYHIIIVVIYSYSFYVISWQILLLTITTVINLSYYLVILDNGKRYNKIINRN